MSIELAIAILGLILTVLFGYPVMEEWFARRRARPDAPKALTSQDETAGADLSAPRAPTGTVTFLFTDIEGSTRLLLTVRDRYAELLAEHRRLLRAAFQEHNGQEVDTQGDAFFVAFSRAKDALTAAVEGQRALRAHPWAEGVAPAVRMGLHTGEPLWTDTGYVGQDVHRAARICAVGHGGQILLSETGRDLVAQDLPEQTSLRDLGSYRLKDFEHPERLFQVLHPELPENFPPLRSLDALPHNLPAQLTRFVGREREIADVMRLMTSTRLLTLTGSGGVGKTRLALEVADDLRERFPDGVWLVELAGVFDPALVPQTLASAVGVREEPSRALVESLEEHLLPKSLLLVLDNCEHLLPACAGLAGPLLRRCPNLSILAASRETLGIPGEVKYSVLPLSLPSVSGGNGQRTVLQSEAARLFLDRATLNDPGFTLKETDETVLVQICRRLDGIPLAIELAAARVKVLSLDQILSRLDDRFHLLTGGSRADIPHHQTLRAALDWSFDLLSEKEKAVLRRLSVFAGGFTLSAAEEVCAGPGVHEDEVLDLLAQLVDKSLVMVHEQERTRRYDILETVRQYGREKLRDSAEETAGEAGHRAWYLRLAVRAESELTGPNQTAWLGELEIEHDNLRAALDSALAARESETALELAGTLWRFWFIRGHFTEGRRWLERVLSSNGAPLPAARSRVLYGAGFLAWLQGDYSRAASLAEESLNLSRQLADHQGIAFSLDMLGSLAIRRGEYEEAQAYLMEGLNIFERLEHTWGSALALVKLGLVSRYLGRYSEAKTQLEKSLALFREAGDKWGIAGALVALGVLARSQGDYDVSAAYCEESLILRRELGDKWGMASSFNSLAVAVRYQGDFTRAIALSEESLKLFRQLEDRRGIGLGLANLGMVALAQKDLAQAEARLRESLVLFGDVAYKVGIAQCLAGLAAVATGRGDPERAGRLLGAADALREASRIPVAPSDSAEDDRRMADAQRAAGPAAFAAARREGRAMTLEQAIAYASAAAPAAFAPATDGPPPTG